MAQERTALVDVDDLFRREQIEEHLAPLKAGVPNLVVTAYCIPNLLGPVHELAEEFPWIIFAKHGFEHTFAECRSWHEDLAIVTLELLREMGYAPLFKPPQWVMDSETELACQKVGVTLHHHEQYEPSVTGLRCYPGPDNKRRGNHEYVHTHIQRNASTDWIGTHPHFTVDYLKQFTKFTTPLEMAVEVS